MQSRLGDGMDKDKAELLKIYEGADSAGRELISRFLEVARDCETTSQLEEALKLLSEEVCLPGQKRPTARPARV